MEATAQQPVAPPQTSAPAIQARRNPPVFGQLVRFTLRDYWRTAWPFLNLAILVAVHSLFFKYQSGQGHFFAVEYAATAGLALLSTAVVFARAGRAESYAILARQVPHAVYTGALMLSGWIIAGVGYLLSTLFDVLYFSRWITGQAPLEWRTPTNYLMGSIPVLVAAAFVVCLTALLSSFVTTSAVRLGIMATIAVLVMSFDSRNFPVDILRPYLQLVPPVLAPVAGALKFATEPDNIAVVSLGLLAGYTFLMAAAAIVMSSNRELILE